MNMQFCTFTLNQLLFGIDVLQVQEIIKFTEITPVPLASKDILGLINLRGHIITVIDIKNRMQMNDTNTEYNYQIVLNTNPELISFTVDEIGDVIETTETPFEPPSLKGRISQVLDGAYKLQDKFLLILNLNKLLQT
jgi:purine-binding chemotaxis protein CheW